VGRERNSTGHCRNHRRHFACSTHGRWIARSHPSFSSSNSLIPTGPTSQTVVTFRVSHLDPPAQDEPNPEQAHDGERHVRQHVERVGLTRRVLETLARELPPKYPWPGNVRELEQAIRRVLVTGHYSGDLPATRTDDAEALAREMRTGGLSAHQLQARYCALLYRELGTLEAVARRTALDRRTVKKYVQSEPARA